MLEVRLELSVCVETHMANMDSSQIMSVTWRVKVIQVLDVGLPGETVYGLLGFAFGRCKMI